MSDQIPPEQRWWPRFKAWWRAHHHRLMAIEDSPHGVTAAKAAGLWCIAVPHEITESLDLSHADLRLQSLADTTLGDVLERRSLA